MRTCRRVCIDSTRSTSIPRGLDTSGEGVPPYHRCSRVERRSPEWMRTKTSSVRLFRTRLQNVSMTWVESGRLGSTGVERRRSSNWRSFHSQQPKSHAITKLVFRHRQSSIPAASTKLCSLGVNHESALNSASRQPLPPPTSLPSVGRNVRPDAAPEVCARGFCSRLTLGARETTLHRRTNFRRSQCPNRGRPLSQGVRCSTFCRTVSMTAAFLVTVLAVLGKPHGWRSGQRPFRGVAKKSDDHQVPTRSVLRNPWRNAHETCWVRKSSLRIRCHRWCGGHDARHSRIPRSRVEPALRKHVE